MLLSSQMLDLLLLSLSLDLVFLFFVTICCTAMSEANKYTLGYKSNSKRSLSTEQVRRAIHHVLPMEQVQHWCER